ncbi:TPA: hypothetical protein QDB05_006160 [Burkholderia vietnamiensis]|nr:hypothetical protein [Burkholderia vietnamiensis]
MTKDVQSRWLVWPKRALYTATNAGLFFAGAANLYVGTLSAMGANVAAAATSLTAGLVLLFAATIDRFESLKGLGVEAKTRQLDEKINEADEALDRLRELTEVTGAAIANIGSKLGRWDSALTAQESYQLGQELIAIMRANGSDESTLRRSLESWVRLTCLDLSLAITVPLGTEVFKELTLLRNGTGPIDQVRIDELETFRQRQSQLSYYQVDDYPDRFLRLLNDAPDVGDATSSARIAGAQYAEEMKKLKEDLCFADPSSCLSLIHKSRNGS